MFEIFQYEFMQRAFLAGTIIGVAAPLIGIFLVVRRYSLMADTLAHVSLLGIAIGIVLNINPFLSAIAVSMLASLGMEKLRNDKKLFGESILSLFLSGALASAVVLISASNGFDASFYSYLFGSIATVSRSDLALIIPIAVTIVITILAFYKKLFLLSLDEELAIASGVKTKFLNTLLVLLAALQVSTSIRVVGVLLIGALMVIPVISAFQFEKSFAKTIIIAVAFSLVSVNLGLFASYYLNIASGGSIVVISFVLFFLSLLRNKLK